MNRSPWLDPLAFGILASLVSAIGSWIPSKWNDEAATTTAASRSLGQLWKMMQHIDAVHGLYYAFMHFWIIPFGTSNFAMRAPSLIAVGFACAGVVVLGKRLATRRAALYAGAVFLLLPRVTWMGVEARSYAFTALVAVWLTILLIQIVDGRSSRWWALYPVVGGIGAILNLYLGLLIVAHGVSLVLGVRRLARPFRMLVAWACASVVAALIALPIMWLVVHQGAQLPFAPLTAGNLSNSFFIQQYFTGATPTLDRYVVIPPTALWSISAVTLACIGWALMIAAVVIVAIRRRRARRVRGDQKAGEGLVREAPLGFVAVTLPWILLPILVVVGYSLAVTTIYTPRYFSFSTPAVALLMGMTLSALHTQWMRIGAIAAIAVIAMPVYISQRGPTAKNATDWQQAAAVIASHAKPGQDIYYGPIVTGGTRSTSRIRDAYPAVLAQLNDITVKKTGVEANTIWDTQYPLTAARGTLGSTKVLWAIIQHTDSTSTLSSVQVRYIEQQGLSLKQEWPGLYTDVLLFTR
jgi:mannosyltransferase